VSTMLELEGKPDSEASTQEGRYLIFSLCGREYGIEILKVREIMPMMNISSLPQFTGHIKSGMNVFGVKIPVIDLKSKLGFEGSSTEKACVIIVEVNQTLIGIIADAALEVINVKDGVSAYPQHSENGGNSDVLMRTVKIKDAVKQLLNMDRLLGDDDICASGKPVYR